MSLVPNIPRPPVPPQVAPRPPKPPAVAQVSTAPARVLEPPYQVHTDLEPILHVTVFKMPLRQGWYHIGWLLYSAFEAYPISTAPEGGFGLFRKSSPESTHYTQYHPNKPGGRL